MAHRFVVTMLVFNCLVEDRCYLFLKSPPNGSAVYFAWLGSLFLRKEKSNCVTSSLHDADPFRWPIDVSSVMRGALARTSLPSARPSWMIIDSAKGSARTRCTSALVASVYNKYTRSGKESRITQRLALCPLTVPLLLRIEMEKSETK